MTYVDCADRNNQTASLHFLQFLLALSILIAAGPGTRSPKPPARPSQSPVTSQPKPSPPATPPTPPPAAACPSAPQAVAASNPPPASDTFCRTCCAGALARRPRRAQCLT